MRKTVYRVLRTCHADRPRLVDLLKVFLVAPNSVELHLRQYSLRDCGLELLEFRYDTVRQPIGSISRLPSINRNSSGAVEVHVPIVRPEI